MNIKRLLIDMENMTEDSKDSLMVLYNDLQDLLSKNLIDAAAEFSALCKKHGISTDDGWTTDIHEIVEFRRKYSTHIRAKRYIELPMTPFEFAKISYSLSNFVVGIVLYMTGLRNQTSIFQTNAGKLWYLPLMGMFGNDPELVFNQFTMNLNTNYKAEVEAENLSDRERNRIPIIRMQGRVLMLFETCDSIGKNESGSKFKVVHPYGISKHRLHEDFNLYMRKRFPKIFAEAMSNVFVNVRERQNMQVIGCLSSSCKYFLGLAEFAGISWVVSKKDVNRLVPQIDIYLMAKFTSHM